MAILPTVVLVHGGFLGPWIWEDVQSLLERNGIASSAPDLPSMSATGTDLRDDVAAVRGVLADAGPALVCGHSYGGLVVTEAAATPTLPVRHLAYLAAAVPDTGESMQTLAASLGVADDDGGEEIIVLDDGRIQLTAEAARISLFHDCPEDRADLAVSRLRTINPATGGQAIGEAAWRQIPATLVEAADDRLPRLVTAGFDAAAEEVVRLPSGHCPQWSRPELVAELLASLVRACA
jgi:pimeloyl-ACP methyl ester carboxylesterase